LGAKTRLGTPKSRPVSPLEICPGRADDVSVEELAERTARGLAGLCRAEGQFTLLLDDAFDIVWHTDSLSEILGYHDIVGRNGVEFVHPDDVALVLDLLVQLGEHQTVRVDPGPAFRPEPIDIHLLTSAGDWMPMEVTTFDYLGDPAVRGFLIICRTVVDRSDIARSIELLGTGASVDEVLPLIARLADRIMGTDARCALAWWHDDDVRLAWSPDAPMPDPRLAETARMALRSGVVDALTITDLSHPLLHGVGPVAAEFGYGVAILTPIIAPEGNEVIGCLLGWGHYPVELSLHPQLPLHIGLRIASLAIMDGRRKGDLRWAASHDPLTLLINRGEFACALEGMHTDDVALLYLDLDDFKPINDVHGHSVGDAVLVEVAARIRETVGIAGRAGRLGGDEFAVACPGLTGAEGWALAARLIAAIRRPIRIGDITVAVGASIGVAMGVQPLIPSILIQRADEALLQAKDAGKNTVKIAA
jgi:diguanylate cyclase (GGDEF)-like protein